MTQLDLLTPPAATALLPEPTIGDLCMVETTTGWVDAIVTGTRASEIGEPFPTRIDVRTTDGRSFHGCHPDCIRARATEATE